jgi:hypothetical protein
MFRRVADVSTDRTALFLVDLNFEGALFVVIGQTDKCNSDTRRFVLVDSQNRRSH